MLIPRLPITIDLAAIKRFALPLALMAEGDALLPREEVRGIWRALYDHDEQDAMISAWGLLIWQQIRDDLLGDELLPFPRLRYTDAFQRDASRANATERVRLQRTLARVSAMLIENDRNPAALKGTGGVQYDNDTGKRIDGLPIGHFRISRGVRVSCLAEEGGLTLRHVGAHDYVNDNP